MKRGILYILLLLAGWLPKQATAQTVNAQNDLYPVLSGLCVFQMPVLSNDQYDDTIPFVIEIVSAPLNGFATAPDSFTINYCSNTGFIGSDQFKYVLYNGASFDTATVYINVQAANTMVFPGDADQNGLVEHFDVLAVGLTYGLQGPPRDSVSMIALAWSPSSFINSNVGAADADGNGLIDMNDVAVIDQFYASSNPFATYHPKDSSNCQADATPAFLFSVSGDSLYDGDTLEVSVQLGSLQMPAHGYGIGFTLEVDADFMSPDLCQLLTTNSWLWNSSSILFRKTYSLTDLQIVLTHTDHTSGNGSGEILRARIPIDDNIDGIINAPGWHPLQISLKHLRWVNEFDVPQDVCVQPVLVNVYKSVSDIKELKSSVFLYPNPADASLIVKASDHFDEIELLDATGRTLQTFAFSNSLSISTAQLADGVYWLKLTTADRVQVKPFIVKH